MLGVTEDMEESTSWSWERLSEAPISKYGIDLGIGSKRVLL